MTYKVIGTWKNHGEDSLSPLQANLPTLDEAESQGQSWGCMSGIVKVEVYSPDGVLQALWDKESTVTRQASSPYWVDEKTGEEFFDTIREASLWQSVGEESQRLRKIIHDETMKAMREGLTTTQAAERLRALHPIDTSKVSSSD